MVALLQLRKYIDRTDTNLGRDIIMLIRGKLHWARGHKQQLNESHIKIDMA